MHVHGGHRKEFFNPLHFRVLETDVSNEKSDIRTILTFILSMIKHEIPSYLGFTSYYQLINSYMQGFTEENITTGIIRSFVHPFIIKITFELRKKWVNKKKAKERHHEIR